MDEDDKSNVAFIVWNEQYSVCHEMLDDEHRRIISMLNALFAAVQQNRGLELLEKTLCDLTEYTHTHFVDEEAVMKECDYPEYEEHKRIHARMTDKTEVIYRRYRMKHEDISRELLQFLKEFKVDKKYAPFISGKAEE